MSFLILIFIEASESPPQKGRFEAAEGPWICKVSIMALTRMNAYIIDGGHSAQKRNSLTMPADELIHLWQGTARQLP